MNGPAFKVCKSISFLLADSTKRQGELPCLRSVSEQAEGGRITEGHFGRSIPWIKRPWGPGSAGRRGGVGLRKGNPLSVWIWHSMTDGFSFSWKICSYYYIYLATGSSTASVTDVTDTISPYKRKNSWQREKRNVIHAIKRHYELAKWAMIW
jgi:hypothetical protein